jgi:hypothetical protein
MSDVNQTFTAVAAIQAFGLGALLGADGQGVRVIVGLKKAAESAQAAGSTLKQEFDASQLLVSLLIGAVAGMLAALPFVSKVASLSNETLIALLGAGYACAGFIEGFMRKALPSAGGAPPAGGGAPPAR